MSTEPEPQYTAAEQQQFAEELHTHALLEKLLVEAFEPGNQQSFDDWNNYLSTRPFKDEKGHIHNPDNGQFAGTNGEYFEKKRQEHYEQSLEETSYNNMSMSRLAREMASANTQNDQSKFTELDVILSQKVEDFADQIRTERNPEGLPEEAREAIHARLRRLIEDEHTRHAVEQNAFKRNMSSVQHPDQPNKVDPPKPPDNHPEAPKTDKLEFNLSQEQADLLKSNLYLKRAYDNWVEALGTGDRVNIAIAADELNYKMYDAVGEKKYKAGLAGLYNSVTVEFKGSKVPSEQEIKKDIQSIERKKKQYKYTAVIIGGVAVTAVMAAFMLNNDYKCL